MYDPGVSTAYDGMAARPAVMAYQISTAKANSFAQYMPNASGPSYVDLVALGVFGNSSSWYAGVQKPSEEPPTRPTKDWHRRPQDRGMRMNPLTGKTLGITDSPAFVSKKRAVDSIDTLFDASHFS